MAGPIACIGTETSPTLAPSLPKTAAALRTLASTSSPIVMSEAFLDEADPEAVDAPPERLGVGRGPRRV